MADHCTKRIEDGRTQGVRLKEKLGVSRNSVREVMHMLEITGLIECVQGSGNYVRCDPEEYMFKSVNMVMSLLDIDYTEVFDIRTGYEEMALKLAIEAAAPEEIEKIHGIAQQMDENMREKILMNRMRAELLRRSHWEIYNALVNKDRKAGLKAFDKHFRIVSDQLDRLNKKK